MTIIPAKYSATVSLRPNRSASGGRQMQPRIVPIDSTPVPSDTIFAAAGADMPAFFASVVIAAGSYTAPAHSPMIATVSSVAFTIVRLRYAGPKISASGCARFASASCAFQRSGSFTLRSVSTETIDRHEAAEKHRAPTVVRADGVVERRRGEEAEVVAGLQIPGAHLPPILGPRFGDVRPGHRPLAADADAGEKSKQAELPDVLRERRGAGEQRVDENRRRERARATEAIGDRTPDEREAPAGEKHGEQNRADESDVRRRRVDARTRQQLGERRREHQRVDHRVHSVEQPARPRGPEADDLLAIQLRARDSIRSVRCSDAHRVVRVHGGSRCFCTLPSAVRGSASIAHEGARNLERRELRATRRLELGDVERRRRRRCTRSEPRRARRRARRRRPPRERADPRATTPRSRADRC